ncbi:MAG: NAD(P)-dependent oxidoreductase [Candidatus Margulisiibacteriota bacterium]|jgi:GDP-L-fucose synthase
MKILITGGNGFIAKSLFESLITEHKIFAPNSKELNLLETENISNFLKTNKFDVIIHSATYDAAPKCSVKDPNKVLENNLRMFFNLVRCQDQFGQFIYFGSGAEFSRKHWQPKMNENFFDQHVPEDQYGFSKYLMNKFIAGNPKIYNLRLFGVFGKYDDWRYRFIPNSCARVLFNENIIIKQNRVFDYLFIDDLAKIVQCLILNPPKKQTFNVCSGITYDLKSLAEKIIAISKKKVDIIIKEPGLGLEYSGDNTLLKNDSLDLNFTPIDDAIKSLYDWYQQNIQMIDQTQLSCYLG